MSYSCDISDSVNAATGDLVDMNSPFQFLIKPKTEVSHKVRGCDGFISYGDICISYILSVLVSSYNNVLGLLVIQFKEICVHPYPYLSYALLQLCSASVIISRYSWFK